MPARFMFSSSKLAESQLATIWNGESSSGRKAVEQASNLIDRELRIDADQKGDSLESFSAGLRRIVIKPLLAYFQVSEPDRRVSIIGYQHVP